MTAGVFLEIIQTFLSISSRLIECFRFRNNYHKTTVTSKKTQCCETRVKLLLLSAVQNAGAMADNSSRE